MYICICIYIHIYMYIYIYTWYCMILFLVKYFLEFSILELTSNSQAVQISCAAQQMCWLWEVAAWIDGGSSEWCVRPSDTAMLWTNYGCHMMPYVMSHNVTRCHVMSLCVCVFNPTFCILMRYHSTACQEYPPDGHGCEGGVCAVDIGCWNDKRNTGEGQTRHDVNQVGALAALVFWDLDGFGRGIKLPSCMEPREPRHRWQFWCTSWCQCGMRSMFMWYVVIHCPLKHWARQSL